MRHVVFPSLFIAVVLAATHSALPQSLEGSPSAGRQVAIDICSGCHQINADLSSKGAYPASFEDITKLPSTTALSLRVFLRSSHINMPNLVVVAPDIDDLIAYILSLKTPPTSNRR